MENDDLKVVIAAGGRFHAIRLAQELHTRQALYRLVSGSYTKADQPSDFAKASSDRSLPPHLVASITSCQVIDQIIWRTRLTSFIRPSTLYVIKDAWFDKRLHKIINQLEPFDIFTGWANYFFDSLPAIREKAKIVIVESGSCHIEEHERLIVEECAKLNLPVNHLDDANRHKIMQEYAASDYIMTPSTFARKSFLRKGFAAEKVLLIPCGMDVEFFGNPNQEMRSRVKRGMTKTSDVQTCHPGLRAGISELPTFRLLFVGQLQIGKGIHILLDAWRELKLSPTKTELLLVGNLQRDARLYLQQHPPPPGVRIIPGVSREDLKKLYASSNAFVLPSIQDGFGMVMGEAMASGLPVIASTNTGGPDIITHGKNGLLVPAGNVEALAQTILQLYQNPALCEDLAINGMQRIQDFTWQRYGDETLSTYKKLLELHEANKAPSPSSRQIQL